LGLAVVNSGWADVDQGLFSISVAAEMAGLHPQTLRIYEREGLLDLEAARTPLAGTSTGCSGSAR
jgi:MerR family regulatory protein